MLKNKRRNIVIALFLLVVVSIGITLAVFTDRVEHTMKFTTASFSEDGYSLVREAPTGPFVAGEDIEVTLKETNKDDSAVKSVLTMVTSWTSPDTELSIFGNAEAEDNAVITVDGEEVEYTVNDDGTITYILPDHILEAGAKNQERKLVLHIPESFKSTGDVSFTFAHLLVAQHPHGFSKEYSTVDLNNKEMMDFGVSVGWAASDMSDATLTPNGHKALMGYLTDKDSNDMYGIEFRFEFNYDKSAMKDFSSKTDAKWSHYKDVVSALTFVEGMTTIGDYTFPEFNKVTSVTFPDSVTDIGISAFDGSGLEDEVVIPATITNIESLAFGNLPNVNTFTFGHASDTLTLPDNTSTGNTAKGAFYVPSHVDTTVNTSVEEIMYGYRWHDGWDNRRKIPTLNAGYSWRSDTTTGTEYISGTSDTTVKTVTFADYYMPSGTETTWDASDDTAPGTVTAYLSEDGTSLTLAGNGYGSIFANQDSTGAFQNFTATQQYAGVELLDTSNTTIMTNMFLNNGALTSLDLKSFDVSDVTHFDYMFCMESTGSSLTNLDVSNWDTSAATHTAGMFVNLYKLTELDVSKWNMTNLVDANYMFHGCTKLKTLDIARKSVNGGEYIAWNTPNLENASYMFEFLQSVKELDISEWDLSAATSTNNMLSGCKGLTSLTLPASLTTFGADFASDCDNVTTITFLHDKDTVLGLPTGGYGSAFYVSSNVETKIVATNTEALNYHWDWDNRTPTPTALLYEDGTMIFKIGNESTYTGAKLVERYKNFDTTTYASASKVPWNTNMDQIKKVIVQDDMSVLGTGYWFYGATNLKSFSGSGSLTLYNNFAVKNTFTRYMFYNCSNLTDVDLSILLDTSNVRNATSMFEGCSSLKSLDLSNFDTSNISSVSNLNKFASGCTDLTTIVLGENFGQASMVPAAGQSAGMFYVSDTLPTNIVDANSVMKSYAWATDKRTATFLDYGLNIINLPYKTEYVADESFDDTGMVVVFVDQDGNVTELTKDDYTVSPSGALSTDDDKVIVSYNDGSKTYTAKVNITVINIIPPTLAASNTWYTGSTAKSTITTINIVDSADAATVSSATESWPAAVDRDGDGANDDDYMCYVNGTTLTIAGNGAGAIALSTDASYTFSSKNDAVFSSVTAINGLNILDTSNTTTMYGMFYKCSSLASLDLTNFNTSNVTNFRSMFHTCSALKELNISSFDTSKATTTAYMFNECSNLTSLDLTNFNTSNVTSMLYMFSGCKSLAELNVTSFNTANVSQAQYMFNNCSSLTSLDVRNFNTSKITSMSCFFESCKSLASIDVSSFDTSKVTSMAYMFSNCSSLTSLDLGNFNTSNVTTLGNMFTNCSLLASVDVSSFDTSKVTNMANMFYHCSGFKTLDISNFDTSSIEDYKGVRDMFDCCYVETLVLGPNFGQSYNIPSPDVNLMFNSGKGNVNLTVYGANDVMKAYDWAANYRIVTFKDALTLNVNANGSVTGYSVGK